MPEEFKWNIDWGDISEEAAQPVSAPPPQTPPPAHQVPAVPISVAPPKTPLAIPPLAIPPPATPPVNPVATPVMPAADAKALVRGQRIELSALGCGDLWFDLAVILAKPGANIGCLGLLENDRLVGSNYFVSPKQQTMPCGSCRVDMTDNGAILHLDLNRAPAAMHRVLVIVFTDAQNGANSHGAGTFEVRRGAALTASGPIGHGELGSGPCALIAEIYRRGTSWRLGLLLASQIDSLKTLLRLHGADVQ